MEVTVNVTTLAGDPITVEGKASWTAMQLKQRLEELTGVPIYMQKLCAPALLSDTVLLGEVAEDDELDITMISSGLQLEPKRQSVRLFNSSEEALQVVLGDEFSQRRRPQLIEPGGTYTFLLSGQSRRRIFAFPTSGSSDNADVWEVGLEAGSVAITKEQDYAEVPAT
eukprot:TRINITY_DN116998_c0_g1_i1.p1 TRINITY_DN116998_c0_g1~~TRINITY_DN116998_c0_g1_i1.p1  ORF type:complete len:168 (-),score=12.90 TRINITY_DN116998_c0_g1_i1:324-827(-)